MEIIGEILKIGASGVVAYLGMLCTKPKERRIDHYNLLIDKFINEMSSAHSFVIEYWSGESNDNKLANIILGHRTESYRLLETINRKGCRLFNFQTITKFHSAYFMKVTGGRFQQQAMAANNGVIDEAARILKTLKDCAEESKIKHSPENIIFLRIN